MKLSPSLLFPLSVAFSIPMLSVADGPKGIRRRTQGSALQCTVSQYKNYKCTTNGSDGVYVCLDPASTTQTCVALDAPVADYAYAAEHFCGCCTGSGTALGSTPHIVLDCATMRPKTTTHGHAVGSVTRPPSLL